METTKKIRLFRVDGKDGVKPLTSVHVLDLEKKISEGTVQMRVLDFNDVEHSMCFNPVQYRYLPRLEDCMTLSRNIICNAFEGKDGFYQKASSNFLAAVLHFFVNYERHPYDKCGSLSDMPHVLSFLNHDYEQIFEVLKTDAEAFPLLAPFITAYDNKAMEQLEGMIGTLRVHISRLATKEAYWVLHHGNDDFVLRNEDETSYVAIVSAVNLDKLYSALALNTSNILDSIEISPDKDGINRILSITRYSFLSKQERDDILQKNFQRVINDIDLMVSRIIGNKSKQKYT